MGPEDDAVGEAELAAAQAVGRRRLLFVAVVLLAEAVALLGVSIFLTANLLGGSEETTDTRNTVIEAVSFVVFAALLVLLARGCVRARRWARAPVIVVQLLCLLGVSINLLQGDLWYSLPLGIPLTIANVLVVLALLTPSVVLVMEHGED